MVLLTYSSSRLRGAAGDVISCPDPFCSILLTALAAASWLQNSCCGYRCIQSREHTVLVTALSIRMAKVPQAVPQQRSCSFHYQCSEMSHGCTSFEVQEVGDSADRVQCQTKQRGLNEGRKRGEC